MLAAFGAMILVACGNGTRVAEESAADPVGGERPSRNVVTERDVCLDFGAYWDTEASRCHDGTGNVMDPATGEFTGERLGIESSSIPDPSTEAPGQATSTPVPPDDSQATLEGTWYGHANVAVHFYDYCRDVTSLEYASTQHYLYPVTVTVGPPLVHREAGLVEHIESNPAHLTIATDQLDDEGTFSMTSAEALVTGQTGNQMVRDLMDVTVAGSELRAVVKNSDDRVATNLTFVKQSSDPCGIAGGGVTALVPAGFADGSTVALTAHGDQLEGTAALVTRHGTRQLEVRIQASH
jgi:hypothetical protein